MPQPKPARRAAAAKGPAGAPKEELKFPAEGRSRVVVEALSPQVDGGRFPVKATPGEPVVVEADVFGDGHDHVACVLLHRPGGDGDWTEVRMLPIGNDRWRGEFSVDRLGPHQFTVRGWVDHFDTWAADLVKRVDAGQDIGVDLRIGGAMVHAAASRAAGPAATALDAAAARIERGGAGAVGTATSPQLAELMWLHGERAFPTEPPAPVQVLVERDLARFSAWYELFPRSASATPGKHGTFADVERRLDYVAGLGFDVLYLPPIHPIGRDHRKGRNNSVDAREGDPGSPWAIGAEEGGHKSVHPELGTEAEFEALVHAARERGLEVAMDVAFQTAPDHPYARDHRDWFKVRPDGTIQYAENPPKKYQDIYPFDFETAAWRELWEELLSVFLHWAGAGVRIFRVDNPHTKPFRFWEWVIGRVQAEHPDTVFLAEAFTRPKVMHQLAKLGFSQSYTYFAWRQRKGELTEYMTELSTSPVADYMRPNLWPNTPDILTEQLQSGGRATFVTRAVLAATLGASYGIYGPAYELCEWRPAVPGKEEYLDSEKYQVRHWDLESPLSISDTIARLNRIRRENPALQRNRGLHFHFISNDELIAYSKATPDGSNVVLTIVNLSPRTAQSGWTHLDLSELGLVADQPFWVRDLLGGATYPWRGSANYVELDPLAMPAHVFQVTPERPA